VVEENGCVLTYFYIGPTGLASGFSGRRRGLLDLRSGTGRSRTLVACERYGVGACTPAVQVVEGFRERTHRLYTAEIQGGDGPSLLLQCWTWTVTLTNMMTNGTPRC